MSGLDYAMVGLTLPELRAIVAVLQATRPSVPDPAFVSARAKAERYLAARERRQRGET